MREIDAERVVEEAAGAADVDAAKRLLCDMRERLENVTGLMASLMRALDGPPGAVAELADFWFAPAEGIAPVSLSAQGPKTRCLVTGSQPCGRVRRRRLGTLPHVWLSTWSLTGVMMLRYLRGA
jgi:hypothetical protein